MLADLHVLAALFARYGPPRVVIPNTPRCLFTKHGSGSLFIGDAPPAGMDPFHARVVYYRTPFGPEPFLKIRSYVELATGASARAALHGMDVVELLRGGTLPGPRGGRKSIIRVAVRADAEPLSAREIHVAVAHRRVLVICAERSVGDASLRFNIAADPNLEGGGELSLLFDEPCRLTDAEIAFDPTEGSLESTMAVIDHFRQHLVRPIPDQQLG